jgi:peptidoglycan/xylan/chitin deacetylase (PgdA/CDA1 family)
MKVATNDILKAALRTLYHTRMDEALAPITKGAGVIFMLHHVAPHEPQDFAPNHILSIAPDFLEKVLGHVVDRDFDIVSLDEAYDRMASGKAGARRFATFTLDDGYRDNIDCALPIFRKYNAPMTIYVAPDFCDNKGLAWWLTLETVVRKSSAISVPFADGEKSFRLTTPEEKNAAYAEIYPWLRSMTDDAIHCHVNRWAALAGINPRAACHDLVMDWDEVRAASRDPLVTIGAHSMSHAALAKCSEDEARWQIEASVQHIEHELGKDCRHFAYPYGDAGSAGPREFEIAGELGLRTAVTTRKGLIGADVRDQLTNLPRLSLNGDFQDERLLQVLLNGAPFKMLDLAKDLAKVARPSRAA